MNMTQLQAIFDVVPSPVFVKNRDHQIVMLNSGGCDLLGHSREVLLTFSDHDLYPPEQVKKFHEADDLVFASGGPVEQEEQVTDGSGTLRCVITRKQLVRFDGEDLLVAVVTDITERRAAEAHNFYLAFHDPLTGLPNRVLLEERLGEALRSTDGEGRSALMYIDLDRFKEVNDGYGHQAGDALIREFAARLSGLVRVGDTVARLGGDEFAILLPGIAEEGEAGEVCQRVLTAAAQEFAVPGGQAFVGASVGIAFASGREVQPIELERRADVALYRAKRSGRGCWRAFTAEFDAELSERHELEADMRQSLATGTGFELHYQPLMAAAGDSLMGMEALLRWRHPTRGLLMPDKFISIAEDAGLIVPLGEWVIKTACAMIKPWPDLYVAVNLSPVQLRREDLANRILHIVRSVGLRPERLELEVTESTILDVNTLAEATLRRLRAAGIRIALDDFGTGYSSLQHLQKLHVDRVKIDRSFISELDRAEGSQAIVLAIANLCHKLGISVTAEGVETEEQCRLLRASACTELQGYLFSRPLPAQEAAVFIDRALTASPASSTVLQKM